MQHIKLLKKIFTVLLYTISIVVLVFAKLNFNNFVPKISTYIDILMLFFVIMIMRGRSGKIVWFAFCIYFIIDILDSQTFGIELSVGVFSVLGVFWFFEEIFTNLSIWTAGILTLFGMSVFKLLYCIVSIATTFMTHTGSIISVGLIRQFAIEIIVTSIVSVPLYAVLMKVGNMITREKIRYS